ncbi:MAG: DUF3857 domain-containing protein [Bacteroidales bacterium]|nr:DUF3857 domain-containing protein [Bacteroidales bacterium]
MKKIFALTLLVIMSATFAMAQDAQYKLIRHTYTVNADGTSDYNFRKELQLLRNRSFSDFGETFVIYNPAFESVKVNEAYTLLKNGTKVPLPENALIDQLPYGCVACARFNGIRELVIVHTALEYDATIVLDYTIHRRSNVLEARLQLQQVCPVDRYEIVVNLPKGQTLNVKYSTPIVHYSAPTVEGEGTNAYRLVATNLPQTFIDSYLPAADKLYNVVTLSNGQRPTAVAMPKTLNGTADLLAELRKDDAVEHIVALRDYVRDNIRTNSVDAALLQYAVPDAQQVWNSGCGTNEEKAALLASLMHQAGFYGVRINDENPQQVVFRIDGLEQAVSVADKSKPTMLAVAQEAVKTISVERDLEWKADELADGFYRFVLPTEPDAFAVSAANLSTEREAPLQASQCDETYNYTVAMPKGYKMLGNAVEVSEAVEGIGKVEIRVKQSGKKLKVNRHLVIERDIITSKNYADFLRLMQLWAQYREFYIKAK